MKKIVSVGLLIACFVVTVGLSIWTCISALDFLEHVEGKEATCTEEGNYEYYRDRRSELLYKDSSGENETSLGEVTIPKLGHSLEHHDAALPSCAKDGNIEYWQCERCGGLFSDRYGQNEIFDIKNGEATGEHKYNTENQCVICHEFLKYTEGLQYTLNEKNENYYTVSGIGVAIDTDIIIPPYYEKKPVTQIGDNAFFLCPNIRSVSLPDSLTGIGNYAFGWCESLVSVRIPKSVNYISESAFDLCGNLEDIEVDKNNQHYKSQNNCLLTAKGEEELVRGCNSGSIPDGVTKIGAHAFSGCNLLKSISIPDSVISIGASAFNNCHSLESVNIPQGVISIGENAFSHCESIVSISIPSSVTVIGDWAFCGCSGLKNLTIQNGASELMIGNDAFLSCNGLTSITIPGRVTRIGDSAFSWCNNLKSVAIESRVMDILPHAFSPCDSLESVQFEFADGWYIDDGDPQSIAQEIPATVFNDTSKAADFLRNLNERYYGKTLFRREEN